MVGASPWRPGRRAVRPSRGDRLEELRAQAFEELFELRIAAGQDSSELIGELRRLLATARPRAAVASAMLALYADGRQGEALRGVSGCPALSGGRAGLDPGPELQELERAILDPGGAATGGSAGPAACPSPAGTPCSLPEAPPVAEPAGWSPCSAPTSFERFATIDRDPELLGRHRAEERLTSSARAVERHGGTIDRAGHAGVTARLRTRHRLARTTPCEPSGRPSICRAEPDPSSTVAAPRVSASASRQARSWRVSDDDDRFVDHRCIRSEWPPSSQLRAAPHECCSPQKPSGWSVRRRRPSPWRSQSRCHAAPPHRLLGADDPREPRQTRPFIGRVPSSMPSSQHSSASCRRASPAWSPSSALRASAKVDSSPRSVRTNLRARPSPAVALPAVRRRDHLLAGPRARPRRVGHRARRAAPRGRPRQARQRCCRTSDRGDLVQQSGRLDRRALRRPGPGRGDPAGRSGASSRRWPPRARSSFSSTTSNGPSRR